MPRAIMDTDLRSTPTTGWESVSAVSDDSPVTEPFTWISQTIGRWSWKVRADWSVLLGPNSPDWNHLENDSRAERIKANDGREVWRVQLGGRVVFVKVARPPRRWARIRRMLSGGDAVREWRAAEYAARYGLRTVCPVALAEAPIQGRTPNNILITVGLPDARPLDQLWRTLQPLSGETRTLQRELIDAVARLIAQAHQCGFEHFDLHAGNVLIDRRADGRLQPLFVDLHNVRIGRPVREATVARNLCQFNQWFRLRAPLTIGVRFLHRYLFWREQLAECSPLARRLNWGRRELVRAIEAGTARHARGLYATRDRRIMRSGRYFGRLSPARGWRGHVFLESKHRVSGSRASEMVFTILQWQDWLRNPLDQVQPPDRRDLLKDSAATTVCRGQVPHPQQTIEVVCKRANARNLYKRLQYFFRPSRSRRTWKLGNALLHRQIPTARPLAMLERRRFGVVLDSLLITEHVADACDLDTLLTVRMREMSPDAQRRLKSQLVRALADTIRALLECGYSHRDFKAPNVMVQWDPERCPSPRIVLVDLDGVKPTWRAERRLLPMLIRLHVSLEHCRRATRTDRLRFLLAYLTRFGRLRQPWKPLWREIAARSEQTQKIRERRQQAKFRKYGRF